MVGQDGFREQCLLPLLKRVLERELQCECDELYVIEFLEWVRARKYKLEKNLNQLISQYCAEVG